MYPSAFNPLGTSKLTKNLAIRSNSSGPRSASDTRDVSMWSLFDGVASSSKMAATVRWREGEVGAVKEKTEGPVMATATPCYKEGVGGRVSFLAPI